MLSLESVSDYPRPPRVESVDEPIRIEFAEHTIAQTTRALRVIETSHPPAYYIPKADFLKGILIKTEDHTFCEFKGHATYWTLDLNNRRSENAAWSYEDPTFGYEAIRGYIAVYPSRVDACYIGEEKVVPQDGNFYGGWITSNLTGSIR